MKKKAIISFLALAIIASASTAYALNDQTTPVRLQNTANHSVKSDVVTQPTMATQTATAGQPSTNTAPTVQSEKLTQPVEAPTPVSETTADETKAEVYQKLVDFAVSKGAPADFTSTNAYSIQTHCIDLMLSLNNISYTDHDKVMSFLDADYFDGITNPDGTTSYMQFENATCRVSQVTM